MCQEITITWKNGKSCNIPIGTTVRTLWTELEEKPVEPEPVGAILNQGQIYMMQQPLLQDGTLEWIDYRSADGFLIYRQSVLLLLLKASADLFPERRMIVQHTISNGVFCEFKDGEAHIGDEHLLTERMNELVAADLPIRVCEMSCQEAAVLFEQQHQPDSVALMNIYPEKKVHLFELDGYYEHFFCRVSDHTGELGRFRLFSYEGGFLLQTPEEGTGSMVFFREQKKLQHILQDTSKWNSDLQITNIMELNQVIENGGFNDLVLVSEALHEREIAHIADEICKDDRIQLIMIAGPSSSGKTSFAQRLAIQLRVNGKRPMTISMDNYFVDRKDTPLDEKGEYDFENLEALQVDLFNQHLVQLLAGERVQLPVYDFVNGTSNPHGLWVQLEKNQPLLIEGIHGLNEKLTFRIPHEQKRMIYISALTQMNMSDSEALSSSECRLLRRIARDFRTRGNDVRETIRRWPSVRRGEKKNIFAFQENADILFNSQLSYELAVLKPLVAPMLEQVPENVPEYIVAQRLLRVLYYILPVDNPHVPYQSLLREFLGGSWFEVE